MEMLQHLGDGFEAAFTLTNMMFICGGVTLGIIFGVTPGLGSVTALAILVPITFYFTPLAAIAFLVGVNKGGTSGGAIPAILINTPGTPEAAATALDGYPLTQKGRPLKAMKTALFSSVCGDTFSDCMLILLAAPFAAIALTFGPPEFTSIIIFSFTLIAALAGKSLTKGIMAAAFGMFLSTWGLDKAKKVEAKVQLILGSNDFLTPRIKAQDLIDNFNQPLVEEIYGSGHSLMMEEPNKVLDYLIKLFKN